LLFRLSALSVRICVRVCARLCSCRCECLSLCMYVRACACACLAAIKIEHRASRKSAPARAGANWAVSQGFVMTEVGCTWSQTWHVRSCAGLALGWHGENASGHASSQRGGCVRARAGTAGHLQCERLLQAVANCAVVGEAHDHGLSALRAEGMQCHAALDALKAHVGRVGMRRARLARRVGETRDRAHDGVQIRLVDEL